MSIVIKTYRIIILSFLLIYTGLLSGVTQDVYSDGIGGFWYSQGTSVIKINDNSEIQSTYSNLMLGEPSSMDASDPFRIMVFYQNTQSIILINNDATILGKPISLSDLGFGEVILACRSARGGAWVLHRESSEIVLIDSQFSTVEYRFSLQQSIKNSLPNYMVESDGVIYIGLNNKTIVRFDSYGATLPHIQIDYTNTFLVEKKYLWIAFNGIVKRVNLANPDEITKKFHCTCNSLPIIVNEKLACFDGEKFHFCE